MIGPARRALVAAAAAVLATLLVAAPGGAQQSSTQVFVFNGEANRLNAYLSPPGEASEFPKQTVIPSAADQEGGRDINAQICFDPRNPDHFIAGEDTGQESGAGEGGLQGWGYFHLTGDGIGEFGWEQLGKMEPTYVHQMPETNPENYGCGFLSNGLLVTSDVGDQFPGEPATGQLIVWYPPFDRVNTTEYCKIDISIPTAGGIYVDEQDRVYVSANRDDHDAPVAGKQAGVYRYSGEWPTSPDAAGGCGRTDPTGAPFVDEGRIAFERFIPNSQHLLTPSAVWGTPSGGFYVSSVFDGKISEYDAAGQFIREVLAPPVEETGRPPYSTGTPFGIGVDSRGTLYYADIGIGLGPPPGPEEDEGSVFRIRFEGGEPLPPEMMDDGLQFPDGIGVFEIASGQETVPGPRPAPTDAAAPSGRSLPTTGGGAAAGGLALTIAGVLLARRLRRR